MASILRRAYSVARTRLSDYRRRSNLTPPLGSVSFGDLRRITPVSSVFGLDRGTPIDRYYIERFLSDNAVLIHGRVLEIADRTYTERFGGKQVSQSDVLHATGDSADATIVADLTNAPGIPTDTFDCVILTQTLHYAYRMEAMVSEIHRVLKPGGCVLCTVPGISQISRYDMDRWGDRWRLTTLSARELFETSFTAELIEVAAHGNVLAATAFLHGLATAELTRTELDVRDDDYQLVVTVRATKASAS
ncbi:MAG: class I SAM-dependent methyltransferase [Coriobacteriia bacterium]|nr:class I SAM-dependent methyltransferase [Coriobacteriia bacterium]